MAWLNELNVAVQETAARRADPLRAKVERYMRGQTAMSTAALLDLLNLPHTTGNGRLLAKTCRSLGFIPLKSCRLMPGGHRGTVTRGWMRPVKLSPAEGETVAPSHFIPDQQFVEITRHARTSAPLHPLAQRLGSVP